MKQLVLALMAISIAAFASTGQQQCHELKTQVAQPARDITSFLETRPSLDTLSGTGCLYILQTLKRLPVGAQAVRELGARGVENTQSTCTTAVNSVRYPCTEPTKPGDGPARCLPEAYSYCGQWAYSMTNQPKYELAMELSTQVEIAYDKAQQLCGSAMSWDQAGTDTALREVVTYLEDRVLPKVAKLEELGCGAE